MFYRSFFVLCLSFTLISCGFFDGDNSDRDTGDNGTDSGISKPWDGTTVNEPRYDNSSRTYYITDATHFAWIMKRTNDNTSITYDNDTIILVNNIDMDNKTMAGIRVFKGTLDGNNKTIFNIYINQVSSQIGLIRELLDNGTVKNLTIRNGTINGRTSVGGIVGRAKNSKLTNVRNINVSVTGSEDSIGGIIGSTDNVTVEFVTNNSKVIGDTGVGGIIGTAKSGKIIKSANSGSLKGKQSVGGIIGRSIFSSVSLSHNNGQILDGIFIGGIFGSSESGTIDNSSNIAKIQGTSSIGGIVGYVSKDVNITHVYNYGELYPPSSSTLSVGRIVGKEGNNFTGIYSKDNNSYLEDNNLEAVGEPKSEDAGFRLDAQQFKDKNNFTSWDFNNIWVMQDKYPVLKWILTIDKKESLEEIESVY